MVLQAVAVPGEVKSSDICRYRVTQHFLKTDGYVSHDWHGLDSDSLAETTIQCLLLSLRDVVAVQELPGERSSDAGGMYTFSILPLFSAPRFFVFHAQNQDLYRAELRQSDTVISCVGGFGKTDAYMVLINGEANIKLVEVGSRCHYCRLICVLDWFACTVRVGPWRVVFVALRRP